MTSFLEKKVLNTSSPLLTILFLRICPLCHGTKHGGENPEKIFWKYLRSQAIKKKVEENKKTLKIMWNLEKH